MALDLTRLYQDEAFDRDGGDAIHLDDGRISPRNLETMMRGMDRGLKPKRKKKSRAEQVGDDSFSLTQDQQDVHQAMCDLCGDFLDADTVHQFRLDPRCINQPVDSEAVVAAVEALGDENLARAKNIIAQLQS